MPEELRPVCDTAFIERSAESPQPSKVSTMNMTIYHWILLAAFAAIVIWAFGRKRKARFEKDARIPLDDKDG
jgi:cbb3-type cytochrome oxidase subunit 3